MIKIDRQMSDEPLDETMSESDSAIVEDVVCCIVDSIEISEFESSEVNDAVSDLVDIITSSQSSIELSDSDIVEDVVNCLVDSIVIIEEDVKCTTADGQLDGGGNSPDGSAHSTDSDVEFVMQTRRVARGRGVQKWNVGTYGWIAGDTLGWRRFGYTAFGNDEEIVIEDERERRSVSVWPRGLSPPPVVDEVRPESPKRTEVSTVDRGWFSPKTRGSPRGGRGGGRGGRGGWQRSPVGDWGRNNGGEGGMERERERSREGSIQRSGGDFNRERSRSPHRGLDNVHQRIEDNLDRERPRSPYREQSVQSDYSLEKASGFTRRIHRDRPRSPYRGYNDNDQGRSEDNIIRERSRSPSRGFNNVDQRRSGDNYNGDRSRSPSRGYNNNDQRRNGDNWNRDRSRSPSRGYNNNDQRRNGDNFNRGRSRSPSRGYNSNDQRRSRDYRDRSRSPYSSRRDNDNRRDRYNDRDRSCSRSRGNGSSGDYDRERSRSSFQDRQNNDMRGDRYNDRDRSRSTVRDRSVQRGRSRSPKREVPPLFALPRNEGDRRTPTPIRELPPPSRRERRERSISREWNPPPLRRKGHANYSQTRSPSPDRHRDSPRGGRRSSDVVDRESNASQYIPPDPRSGRRDRSPARPEYGWKTRSVETGAGLSESRPIVLDEEEGGGERRGDGETGRLSNPISNAFSSNEAKLSADQSQMESIVKSEPEPIQSTAKREPKDGEAKPLINGRFLAFSLDLFANYEAIIQRCERLLATVTVVRRPVSVRPGACVLEFETEVEATILHSQSPMRFGENAVPLSVPALIGVSMEREGMERVKMEEEMEKQFGPLVQMVVDGRTKTGWAMFMEESSAARALAVGSLQIGSNEGWIRFEGIDEGKNGGGLWQMKEDRKWMAHRLRVQRCRCMATSAKSNDRAVWKETKMRTVIDDQIRDDGTIVLVGGPIVGGLSMEAVSQYFMNRCGAAALEVEPPTADEPGTFEIELKVMKNGDLKMFARHLVIELLTSDHVISGYSIGLGMISPIEMVTTPIDPKLQRMIVLEFQKKFGAVIGFTEKGKKDGRGTYRVGFMNFFDAAHAHKALSTLVKKPFLPEAEKLILYKVEHLKTWAEQKE